jgi:uncharacterized protein YuzE
LLAKRIAPLNLGPYTFDHAHYDKPVDILYLSIGPEGRAVASEDTPEGHAVSFDGQGNVVGLIVMAAKERVERDGKLVVTIPVPKQVEVAPGAVEGILAATAA